MNANSTANHRLTLFIGLAITLGIMVAGGRDPLGQNFVRIVIPGLALLNSTQWFLLGRKFGWSLLGFCISLAAAAVLLHLSAFSAGFDFANFVTIFFLGMSAQFAAFWLISTDRRAKNAFLAETIAIGFVVFMGRYMNARHLEMPMASAGRFLFWSPLSAMCLWLGGAISNWRRSTQIVAVCIIAQIGTGLLDVGGANNLRWMVFSAFVVWFSALALIAYRSRNWRGEERDDRAKRE
jgi:hypothetical protein